MIYAIIADGIAESGTRNGINYNNNNDNDNNNNNNNNVPLQL